MERQMGRKERIVDIETGRAPLRRRDGIALVVIGVLALVASAASFVAGQMSISPPQVAATDADDAPRVPLPAGPRKYQ
jgi:hypothetical protein